MTPKSQYSEIWSKNYLDKVPPIVATPIIIGSLLWEGTGFWRREVLVDSGSDFTIVPPDWLQTVERKLRLRDALGQSERLNPACKRTYRIAGVDTELSFYKVWLDTELEHFGECEVTVYPSTTSKVLLGRDLLRQRRLILVLDADQELLVKAERHT